jgi:hypothetical protein
MKAYLSRRLRRLMDAVITSAVLCTTALMAACGGGSGGGGDGSLPAPPPVPVVRSAPLEYGYFGTGDTQLAETADSVTFVFAMDWGNWDTDTAAITARIIAQLQEARARGVTHAWVCVGYQVFDAKFNVRPDAIARLHAFRVQIQALDLYSMVTVLYPLDEPNVAHVSDAKLTPLLLQIKAEWAGGALLGVIYGDTQSYAGISVYDLLGKDKYGDGSGVLNELPPLTGTQLHILVPGGASGLSNHGPDDPAPFMAYAKANANVYAIVPFLWVNSGGITGIRNNGQAPAYTAIGKSIKGSQ